MAGIFPVHILLKARILNCHGHEAGYSEDSKNPAEFLINPYVHAGKNTLTLKIYRWSTGSYLECQDFWRISGIERDVFLYAQPKAAVKDFCIKSTLDDSYRNGIFSLKADLRNRRGEASELSLTYELLDAEGKTIATETRSTLIAAGGERTLSFETQPDAVHISLELFGAFGAFGAFEILFPAGLL